MTCCYDHGKRSLDKLTKIYFDCESMHALCLYSHNFIEKFNNLDKNLDQ